MDVKTRLFLLLFVCSAKRVRYNTDGFFPEKKETGEEGLYSDSQHISCCLGYWGKRRVPERKKKEASGLFGSFCAPYFFCRVVAKLFRKNASDRKKITYVSDSFRNKTRKDANGSFFFNYFRPPKRAPKILYGLFPQKCPKRSSFG